MNREERNHIRRLVLFCRNRLEREYDELLRLHGIFPDHRLPVGKIPCERAAIREKLDQALERENPHSFEEARRRWILHAGFTYLNRLLALRVAEVNGLIKETIATRPAYGNRSLRERDLADVDPALAMDPEKLSSQALSEAFSELDIPLLFQPEGGPYSLLQPRLTAYRELREAIQGLPEEIWRQFESLGWAYQYFNDETRREIRQRLRRNPAPDDIPPLNQFYTVEWIVKFLVHNTVGRYWLQANPDSALKEKLDYLVPEEPPSAPTDPGKIDIKTLKVLDPACGSGHFLLQTFDLLFEMWREAEPGLPAWQIPAQILEHNLFGVDIDLRACQIAALSLYLKARTVYEQYKVAGAAFSPARLNIVCADIRFIDGNRRQEFMKWFTTPLKEVIQNIIYAAENGYTVGSLLKVRQPLEEVLRKCATAQGENVQMQILPDTEPVQQRLRFSPGKGSTLEAILHRIKGYIRSASETSDMGTMFFGFDAERAVHLIDVLSEQYDIVLMNPPYGAMPAACKEYARKEYRRTHSDFYAAFIEQAVNLTKPGGYIGALTGRTFMFLKSFQQLREKILRDESTPKVVLDLGFNVLDGATARWAAFTLKKETVPDWQNQPVIFFRLTPWQWDEKRIKFEEALAELKLSADVRSGEDGL